jgi:membrane protease YdiL (CAAX protease family)
MRLMNRGLNAFGLTVLTLWVVGSVGAILYANQQHIPQSVWMIVLPALLIEATLYIAPGFPVVRERLARLGGWLPPLMALSAVVPYTLLSIGLGNFRLEWVGALIVLSLVVGLWYRVFPRNTATDLLFLALMAGIFLSKLFSSIYVNPNGKPALDILGRLMWIRMGVLAVMLVRGAEGVEFGFVPRAKDWVTGARYFLYAIPFLAPVGLWIGFVQRKNVVFGSKTVLVALGTFLGMLWVVALAEEFFFRGLLQQGMQKLTGSLGGGLLIASVLFGAAHLGMRGFPNWKFALLATIAGVFYGLAYARSGSIRASMVTHALVNTTWRVFFS